MRPSMCSATEWMWRFPLRTMPTISTCALNQPSASTARASSMLSPMIPSRHNGRPSRPTSPSIPPSGTRVPTRGRVITPIRSRATAPNTCAAIPTPSAAALCSMVLAQMPSGISPMSIAPTAATTTSTSPVNTMPRNPRRIPRCRRASPNISIALTPKGSILNGTRAISRATSIRT